MSAAGKGLTERLRAAGCVRAEEEAALLSASGWRVDELEERVRRRERGEPLEWILGWAEFACLRLAIEPGVFVPRQRTVFLAERASALLAGRSAPRILLDVCTGCGAIACVVARDLPGALVVAGDVDPVAVSCAKENGVRYGVSVVISDLLAGFPGELRGSVQVVVANVPYVPHGEIASMPVDARNWEPQRALAGGSDGLQVFRRLAAQAAEWLAPGGSLLTEISPKQTAVAADHLRRLGYTVEAIGAPGDDETVLLTGTVT